MGSGGGDGSPRPIALLDANVIYPYALRQILLNVAELGGFAPRWSAHILDEVGRHLKADRGLTDGQWGRLSGAMRRSFPFATVAGYEPAMSESSRFVRDPGDAHVVAAARRARCDSIVTENLKHFDRDALAGIGIRANTTDGFLTEVFRDRRSRGDVYAGVLVMSAEMRDQPGITTLLATFLRRSRLYGLCQQINLDMTQNLDIAAPEIDERAVRARMRQIEQGIGI